MIALPLRRTLAAVLLSATALGLGTAAATPAEAATTVKVRALAISGGKALSVVGTTNRDVITVNGSTASIDVSTGNVASVPDGSCTQLAPTLVRCTGITLLQILAGSGNDEVRNNTAIPMGTNGGSGNDILVGGSGKDTLNGGPDFDNANGRGGVDTCGGDEVRTSCEEVTS